MYGFQVDSKLPTGMLSFFFVLCLIIRIIGGGFCSSDESGKPAIISSMTSL